MRVLHVYKTYFPETQGGLEEVIRQICLYTRPLGVESRILTLARNAHPAVIQLPEATVHRLPRQAEVASCGLSWPFFAAFREQAAWADVIHYHFPWPMADLAHLRHAPDRRSIVTYHADIVRQQGLLRLYRPLMNRFLARVDAVVATSDNYRRTSPVLQALGQQVQVIPIGLGDGSLPNPCPRRLHALQDRFGTDFLFFIGVLRYYKGLHILLQALAAHPDDAPTLVIAGTGPMEVRLHRQARRIGLNRIHFLGPIDEADKHALLHLCRAVVFPSHLRSEAFGVTLLEGAMHGKPLISTDIGTGTSYVNRDGHTGLVIPPDDPQALRRAMDTLYRDPVLAQRLGEGARHRYLDHFTAPRMAEAYHRLYQNRNP